MKDYSPEAYAEIRRDLNELAKEFESESEKLKMKPIIVKGVQCRSEFADVFNTHNERMKLKGE